MPLVERPPSGRMVGTALEAQPAPAALGEGASHRPFPQPHQVLPKAEREGEARPAAAPVEGAGGGRVSTPALSREQHSPQLFPSPASKRGPPRGGAAPRTRKRKPTPTASPPTEARLVRLASPPEEGGGRVADKLQLPLAWKALSVTPPSARGDEELCLTPGALSAEVH